MRRSIDDYPFSDDDLPAGADDAMLVSWAVAISDDYDDTEPRVVLTVEEVGHPYRGIMATGALLTLVDRADGRARVAREAVGSPMFACYRESAESVEARFEAWVRRVIVDARGRWCEAQP